MRQQIIYPRPSFALCNSPLCHGYFCIQPLLSNLFIPIFISWSVVYLCRYDPLIHPIMMFQITMEVPSIALCNSLLCHGYFCVQPLLSNLFIPIFISQPDVYLCRFADLRPLVMMFQINMEVASFTHCFCLLTCSPTSPVNLAITIKFQVSDIQPTMVPYQTLYA